MIVHVKLFATLRRHYPNLKIGEEISVELPEEATIDDLIKQLRLPKDQIKVVFVNAVIRSREHVLADGDEVGIFPPVGGG